MSLLFIIKVSQNGISREFHFNTPGPVYIGSGKDCEISLDHLELEEKLLEVLLSDGQLYLREIGSNGKLFINSMTPQVGNSILYNEGECIGIRNTNYQIYLYKTQSEVVAPPPFFEEDFKERLDRLELKISEKNQEIKILDGVKEKKDRQLVDLENICHENKLEKNRLYIEINKLKAEEQNLSNEIQACVKKGQQELDKTTQLQCFLKTMEIEERVVQNKIDANNQILDNLEKENQEKSKQIDNQREVLCKLDSDLSKIKEQLRSSTVEYENQELQIHIENEKIKNILINSEEVRAEGIKIQAEVHKILKEKIVLEMENKSLAEEIIRLSHSKNETMSSLIDLKNQIHQSEIHLDEIEGKIQTQLAEEQNLKSLNGELHSELLKVEDKLALKNNQLNLIDFQSQEIVRKLTTASYDLEITSSHLKEIKNEEIAQELKIQVIVEELKNLNLKALAEKKEIAKSIEAEKTKLQRDNLELVEKINVNEKLRGQYYSEQCFLKGQIAELRVAEETLQKEKKSLEAAIYELDANKKEMEKQVGQLKEDIYKTSHEHQKIHRELSLTKVKLMDCESSIKEKEVNAKIEIENFKRTERAKILAEKSLSLSEIEANKQKSLSEIHIEYNKKHDDFIILKTNAEEVASEILADARKVQAELHSEANKRLQDANLTAEEREVSAHQRISKAQEYFKQKEIEADEILTKARQESARLLKNAEDQMVNDLGEKKEKIKKFLNMKQEIGLAHLKLVNEQAVLRSKRIEEKNLERIEELKRKELKKVAKMREEELSQQAEMKANAIKDLRNQKEKMLKDIQLLKDTQETELAEKRKTVIDHINATKFDKQKDWEEELKREKELFQLTKKNRIENSTQAVMNVLITEMGVATELEVNLKNKIYATLEMAISGQNANAIREVGQVLDINPQKRKNIFPVLGKYAVSFGIPATFAFVLLTDIGSVRSAFFKKIEDLINQNNVASEKSATKEKEEWKEKFVFNPPLTVGFKPTFTDNIVYTKDFLSVVENEEFQNDWILKVHDFMTKDLELSEDIAINYISSEGALIKELSKIRKEINLQTLNQGLLKMGASEETHLGWLKTTIPLPENFEKFATFRKEYFDKYYQEKFLANREIATVKELKVDLLKNE